MDETSATILFGCKLANDLEANIQNMGNQPEFIWRSCDEIIRVFSNVKERLSLMSEMGNTTTHLQNAELDMHGWIEQQETKSGVMRDVVLERTADVGRWLREHAVVEAAHNNQAPLIQMSGGGGGGSGGGGGTSSSSPRQRRRKNEGERRRVILAAPRIGNTDIPPEDGYTWRKYGQKDILKSKFPRSYFRCTHQKLYNCPAKKQVQRLDNDPTLFEVIYRSNHTCHLSSTAPSVQPSSTELRHDVIQHATNIHPPILRAPSYTATTPTLNHYLSMDIMRDSGQVTSGGLDFTMQIGGGSGVGGGGVDDHILEYMTETMFNSGSSSNNSMDLIFSSLEDKKDSGEKKN